MLIEEYLQLPPERHSLSDQMRPLAWMSRLLCTLLLPLGARLTVIAHIHTMYQPLSLKQKKTAKAMPVHVHTCMW